MRASAFLLLAAITSCAAAPDITGPPSPLPHAQAEIDRFEAYRGPGGEAAAASWRTHFVEERLHRAFAVSPHHYGYRVGALSADSAIDGAMQACDHAAGGRERCMLYAIDMQVVMPGQEAALPFRGRPIGTFTPAPPYRYHGPEAARGLVIWSHGKTAGAHGACDADGAAAVAPAVVTLLNRDGWDVVRFDRDPCHDDLAAALRAFPPGVAQARRLGYRRVVLAGQSRGAIQSLEALRDPAVARQVDAVLAFSPARSGKAEQAETLAPQRWRALVDALAGPELVAVFYFDHDPYNPHAREQAAYAEQAWRTALPNAHVYFDPDPLFTTQQSGRANGHAGALHPAFAAKYGACLTTLLDTGRAEAACAPP